MKFFEAVEIARKTGKKIGTKLYEHYGNVSEWRGGTLVWENSSQFVFIDENVIDADWQVIEPPPKLYTFAEAYEMMKAGKWMIATSTKVMYTMANGVIEYKYSDSQIIHSSAYISIDSINSQWQEANP